MTSCDKLDQAEATHMMKRPLQVVVVDHNRGGIDFIFRVEFVAGTI